MRFQMRPLVAVAGLTCVLGCAPSARSGPGAFAVTSGPLAKVKSGMTFSEVVALLGPPTSQTSQLTPHAFNPFAIGNQGQTTAFHYARIGRVIFAGPDLRGQGTAVIAVEEDPREPGGT